MAVVAECGEQVHRRPGRGVQVGIFICENKGSSLDIYM